MNKVDGNTVFTAETACEVFGTIDRTMLATGTTESNLEVRETTFKKTLHMVVYKRVNRVEEGENLSVLFEEVDNGFVQSCDRFELIVLAGIMRGTAVKDIAASVS